MDDIRPRLTSQPDRFVDQLRHSIRTAGLSYSTEKTYVHWAVRYIRQQGLRHPRDMGADEVTAFLTDLSVVRHCSSGTQRTALNALVFLYDRHLKQPLGDLAFSYAKRRRRVPTAFTHLEATAIIQRLEGVDKTIASLLYGSGLRLVEALNLRVKDLDFESLQITVRDGKGGNERFTLLPRSLVSALREQLHKVAALHQYDLARGYGEVFLPDALERKYPRAAKAIE